METTQETQIDSIHDLQPKMKLQGVVRETQLYGALVDIGLEQDGLVHISQLSHSRVNRVTDVVKPGDNVTVWVTKVEPSRGRIGLSMVEPAEVSWRELKEGQVYTGKVTRIEPYGAFIDIGAQRHGLLHVREMSAGYVRHPSDVVNMGDEVEVRVLKIDRRKRRIDLSMLGIEFEIEEDVHEEPTKTTMEIALQRAQQEQERERHQEKRDKPDRSDLAEREDILARTLKEHSKR